MTELVSWFERKFAFAFPVELYPNVSARLRGTPARLEELVRGFSSEQRTRKSGGKWSIQENVGHLGDLEPLWIARIADFLKGVETLTVADLTNRKTDEANHNSKPLAVLLERFRSLRSELLRSLDGLEAEVYARSALHPRLKTPMRLVDHLYFIAEHDDHHLARIWELGRL